MSGKSDRYFRIGIVVNVILIRKSGPYAPDPFFYIAYTNRRKHSFLFSACVLGFKICSICSSYRFLVIFTHRIIRSQKASSKMSMER